MNSNDDSVKKPKKIVPEEKMVKKVKKVPKIEKKKIVKKEDDFEELDGILPLGDDFEDDDAILPGIDEFEEYDEIVDDDFEDFEEDDDEVLPGLEDEIDNIDDFEEIEEVEDLDDDFEEIEEVEDLDDDFEEIEEVEDLDDDFEEIEEVEDLDDDFEEIEEVEDLDDDFEEIEEVEDLDDDFEEIEEVEDLDDDFEEIEEVEDLDDDFEEIEEVEDLDDDFEEIEEVEESDDDDEVVEADEDDFEEIEEVEELDDDDEVLPGLEEDEEEDLLPGLEEDDEEDLLPGLDDDDEEDLLPGLDDDDEEDLLPGLDDDEEVVEDDEDDFEEIEEVEELNDDDEIVEADEDDFEEIEEVEELDDDEEVVEADEDEEVVEADEDDFEEIEEVEELDDDDEIVEADEDDFEEIEEVEELDDDDEIVENEENKFEDTEEVKELENNEDIVEENNNVDVDNKEEVTEDDEIDTDEENEVELQEDEEIVDEVEMKFADDYDEVTEEEEDEDEDYDDEEEEESIYPDELIDIELECIYLGMLFNNPKAMSRFYFLYEDCRFSDNELTNLYKIVLFRDGEAYAPAIAKNKYQLPRETPNTYDLKLKVRKIAAAGDYDLETIYVKLKKLFILKKNYLTAATNAIQEKILEIQHYELYADMTVEEVENALEQITVTTGLTQGRLNENTTDFLLAGDNELSNGLSIPFNILSTVFKGLRRGETMCYAMPSNCGKSRFTINLASYISFIHKEKVLIISNEMAEDKMKLCMITTILNNPEIQELHGQKISVTEGELLELKFRPDKGKKVKCDENGYILRKEGETQEEYIEKLKKNSEVFNQTLKVTDWVNTQINNSIFFIHITEHTNDDLKKIIMNYYYKEGIHYMFYDTLKADTANIGNSDEVKKTATILSNLAQKFRIFIASSMQLIESNTLPVNLTVNEMSASKTVKEVLDTLCLIKQISRASLYKYEYADTDHFDKCYEIDVPIDTDVRFYACVVDKNRAGAKPTVLFRLNLAYNRWEELGHLRLKQTEFEED